MSVLTTTFARAGFTATLVPPQPGGIYFDSVAVYNALTQVFAVQNGTDQDNLGSQLAQLYQIPTTGQALSLNPQPRFYPYGSYLGPVQAVWYGPTDSPGSFPTTLGALTGLIQWTPTVTLDPANAVYLVPGTSIIAIVVANASDTSETITVTGVQSGLVVGTGTLGGQSSIQINLEAGTNDSVFAVTSSGDITCTLSLIVGVPPVVNQGGGGGSVTFYASLTGTGQVDTPGALTQAGQFQIQDNDGVLTFQAPALSSGAFQLGADSLADGVGSLFAYLFNATIGGKNGLVLEAGPGPASASIGLAAGSIAIEASAVNIEGAVLIAGASGSTVIRVGINLLGFFNTAPVGPQSSGGTLAGVIDGLIALGLFSS